MRHPEEIERARAELQHSLDAARSRGERNRLGQFATPPGLALDILRYAKGLFGEHKEVRFLDPAFGTGAFFSALLEVFPARQIGYALGYEVDPYYGLPTQELWKQTALELRLADFTSASPPEAEAGKLNLVVCNPPYVRHHHLSREEKLRLGHLVQRRSGQRFSALAGLYPYYLCLTQPWMTAGGLGIWLIPSEFMDVNYGKTLKEYLLSRVTLLRLHRFDPSEVQFEDALVSSAVVVFRNALPRKHQRVTVSFGGSLTKPRLVREVAAEELAGQPKWTAFPRKVEADTAPGVTLGDLFFIKRGIATGANSFFTLSPEEAEERRIPKEFLSPILPSPRNLAENEILADAEGNPVIGNPLVLLSCDLPEPAVRAHYPSLWKYLELGVGAGVSQRYLSRNRAPWYSQEKRRPAPFLCTYMGRRISSRGRSPFRFILNHSRAIAANVYLMIYPKPFLQRAMAANPGLKRAIWMALGEISAEILVGNGRVYGGGLHKMEPKELGRAPGKTVLRVLPKTFCVPHAQEALF